MSKSYIQLLDDIGRAINRLPTQIATKAVNFSKRRFVKQNWQDATVEPWEKRKNRRRGSNQRQRGAVLVDSGRLKRSIRTVSATPSRIIIGTDVPYAEAHNEGLNKTINVRSHRRRSRRTKPHTVRAHSRRVNLPSRRFIGESQELCNQVEQLIINNITQAINK